MGNQNNEGAAFFAGLVIGGLVGAALAMLLAPQSGEETRAQIRDMSLEYKDRAGESLLETRQRAAAAAAAASQQAQERVTALQEKSVEVVEKSKQSALQAVEKGKQSATEAFEKGRQSFNQVVGSKSDVDSAEEFA